MFVIFVRVRNIVLEYSRDSSFWMNESGMYAEEKNDAQDRIRVARYYDIFYSSLKKRLDQENFSLQILEL